MGLKPYENLILILDFRFSGSNRQSSRNGFNRSPRVMLVDLCSGFHANVPGPQKQLQKAAPPFGVVSGAPGAVQTRKSMISGCRTNRFS